MTARLDARFAKLKKEKRAALIAYIMGGDPDLKQSAALLEAMPDAGADIIELGFPFSDPMADGPVIQAAAGRSLKAGTTLSKTLKLVSDFRKANKETPLILMGYYNPVLQYGPEKLVTDAIKAGVDGLLIVDLPPEEDNTLISAANKVKLAIIKLAAPTTTAERAKTVLSKASGFLYYVSITGITGAKTANFGEVKKAVTALKSKTNLPVAVGFGIKTPADAKVVAGFADAVVVGSALVRQVAQNLNTPKEMIRAITADLGALAKALR